jgi:hypothetical protein
MMNKELNPQEKIQYLSILLKLVSSFYTCGNSLCTQKVPMFRFWRQVLFANLQVPLSLITVIPHSYYLLPPNITDKSDFVVTDFKVPCNQYIILVQLLKSYRKLNNILLFSYLKMETICLLSSSFAFK